MKNIKPGHVAPVVYLDAGHYGKYNRSPVVSEYYESEMTWKLHKFQEEELKKYGITVALTRGSQWYDRDLISRGRASSGADLLISNHSNAASDASVDRPEAIYLVDDNCSHIDEASREIAGLLASVLQSTMQTVGAAKVYSKLSSTDRDGDGKKNDDYYGILYGAHQVGTPAIILEHSFHTNKRAAQWLLSDDNLRKLAMEEARVIAEWFGINVQNTTARADPAASFALSKAGAYKVVSSDGTLNLRSGASTQKPIVEVLNNNDLVNCYGYYTGDWLYVVSAKGNVGFCHSGYLSKV